MGHWKAYRIKHLAILLATASTVLSQGWLNLTIIHTNDIHSRVDPANALGVDCTAQNIEQGNCYGGAARHKSLIEQLRKGKEHSLFLDGGDEFQGTQFYSYYKGNVTAEVMNTLGYDATTVGNHEWDDGPEALARFWAKLKMPIVCCNVDFTKNPKIGELVKPYHIFEDLQLAVIGYITPSTSDISSSGPTISFTDPVPAVQKAVDELEAKGIRRIIALSHHGYEEDMNVAAKTHGVDLIVGGHSHSYLGDPSNPLSKGPYPTKVKNLKGTDTLIVQAYCWGRFIGNLDVSFDPEGDIVTATGGLVQVEHTIAPEVTLAKEIDGWRDKFEAAGKVVLGVAADDFPSQGCKQGECAVGNLVANAMLDYAREPVLVEGSEKSKLRWTDFALMMTGGIRSGIPKGDITVGLIGTLSPFGNILMQIRMKGQEILDMIDAVSIGFYLNTVPPKEVSSNIQISGLRYTYDSSRPINSSRLVKAEIQGVDKKWQAVERTKVYSVITLDFLVNGGDNILHKAERKPISLDRLDKVLRDYIKKETCVSPTVDGRIRDVAAGRPAEDAEGSESELGGSDGYQAWMVNRRQGRSFGPLRSAKHMRSKYPAGQE